MSGRHYPQRPVIGIGVVVLRGADVLLVRRAQAPAAGQWSLPGGGQELGETTEAAARRELREETGITAGQLRLVAVFDMIERDDAGTIAWHYTIIDYAAPWQAGEPRPGGDVDAATFVAMDKLDAYQLSATALEVIARTRSLLSEPV